MANMQIVPAGRNINVEPQYVEMMVNVDFEQQKVTICNKYDVLATVRSKRKAARFWNPEDNNVNIEVVWSNYNNELLYLYM
ncbi:hypothetical protein H5410_017205 [Solanum commersonii]|uniref:Uncharacterized protein n=1 Tax=Solanum commersonii TaxID=4109 RepID=A0A9J5ZYH4_SOLCO|nr:hypothetical protein H5410_017205 [Solanum commersonii]